MDWRDIAQCSTSEDYDKLLVRLDKIEKNYDDKEAIDMVRQQVEERKGMVKGSGGRFPCRYWMKNCTYWYQSIETGCAFVLP